MKTVSCIITVCANECLEWPEKFRLANVIGNMLNSVATNCSFAIFSHHFTKPDVLDF